MNHRAVLVAGSLVVAATVASPVVRTAGERPAAPAVRAVGGLPTAADGTRLSACRTGRCEVLVSAHDRITPPVRLGVPSVRVTSVSGRAVAYRGTGPGITLTLSGQRPGTTSFMNRLAITTVAVSGGRAVVRFAPR
jgi:hypothetical protein